MMNNGTTANESMLERITKLLRKAESTNHPAEAEALMAKAMELMMKWSIDDAMIDSHLGRNEVKDEIVKATIDCTGTYWKAHSLLAVRLGRAFKFELLRLGATQRFEDDKLVKIQERIVWVGFKSDIDKAQLLYASLMVQAASALKTFGQEQKWYLASLGGMDKFIARRSFLLGFGEKACARLVEQRTVAVNETPGAGLVLVDRATQVTNQFADWYPNLRDGRSTTIKGNMVGSRSGRAAGARANIGSAAGQVKGGPLALGY